MRMYLMRTDPEVFQFTEESPEEIHDERFTDPWRYCIRWQWNCYHFFQLWNLGTIGKTVRWTVRWCSETKIWFYRAGHEHLKHAATGVQGKRKYFQVQKGARHLWTAKNLVNQLFALLIFFAFFFNEDMSWYLQRTVETFVKEKWKEDVWEDLQFKV